MDYSQVPEVSHRSMTPFSKSRAKGVYISRPELELRYLNDYGPDYFAFFRIFVGWAPRICPRCQTHGIKILYLGLPNNLIDGKIWCKWYLWCDACRSGIYCPLGTYRIPIEEPHILWGDEKALADHLPKDLELIPVLWPKKNASR